MSARRSSDRADFQEQKIVPVRCGVIPTRRNKMPIKTDDPAALEKLDAKLNACIKLQETMKAVNAIVRSNRSNEEKRTLIMNKHHINKRCYTTLSE